jgi:hypothetical protein
MRQAARSCAARESRLAAAAEHFADGRKPSQVHAFAGVTTTKGFRMTLRQLSLATAAASLAAMPVAAQAATATVDRASAPADEQSDLAGGIGPAVIIVLIAAVGMGLLLLLDNNDDNPVSA